MRNGVEGDANSRNQFYREAGIDPNGEEFLEGLNLGYKGIIGTIRGGARLLSRVFDVLHRRIDKIMV